MCVATSPAVSNKQAASRVCRWISLDPKWHLENNRCACLMLSIGGKESFYYVSRLDAGVWWMAKESEDHSEPEACYTIETCGERDTGWWICSCPDHQWRKRGRKDGCCKHIAALRSSLAAIGVDPVA